jgi:hypothetical protein
MLGVGGACVWMGRLFNQTRPRLPLGLDGEERGKVWLPRNGGGEIPRLWYLGSMVDKVSCILTGGGGVCLRLGACSLKAHSVGYKFWYMRKYLLERAGTPPRPGLG